MSTADFSRQLFQPEKRYTGAFLQQGRVLTDEDLNAHRRLAAEDERLTFREIVCATGSSNDGFLVQGVSSTLLAGESVYDFSVAPGSYYLGGLRFSVLESEPESFLHQTDWLQIDLDASALPHLPTVAELTDANGNPVDRYDLVYLQAWEQTVSAVEDSELFERALGGPDTSVYSRRMRRLGVLTTAPGDCVDAFARLVEVLTEPLSGDTSGTPHQVDGDGCQLVSKARLTIAPTGTGPSEDLCKPQVVQGYLGAENQAIRIQLTATDRFIWGYDNAAPLYRVQITREAGLNQIKFLTPPRDAFAQPKAGQAVEILRWGALLPNREKVSELGGHLTTVETSYNPDDQTLVVSEDVPGEWVDWLNDPAHAAYVNELDAPTDQKYFYLRLWTGGSGDAAQPDHPFTPGTPVDLAETGLSATFSNFGLPDDYWVVAARPNTPDRVVPWSLLQEAPAFGPRRFFATLALIRWHLEEGEVESSVLDCRTRFQPLCQLKGCCTLVVGDGRASHGEFQSIQDAVDALPESGGEICVLPGLYEESVRIENRTSITIRGCGLRTRVAGSGPNPVIEVIDSQETELSSLAISAEGTLGVHAHSSTNLPLEGMRLDRLTIESRDRSAIVIEGGHQVEINSCAVTVLPLSQPLETGVPAVPQPAVFVRGEHVQIERNSIIAAESDGVARRAFGGLHIGGDSRDVEIRRNVIRGGNNHGITLGSVVVEEAADEPGGGLGSTTGGGWVIVVDERGCIHIYPVPPTGNPDQPGPSLEAGPPLYDVRIIENLIEDMGMSGISVARFFEMDDDPDFISIVGLLIAGNRIRNCMRLLVGPLGDELRDVIGFGGVALADVEGLIVRDNLILRNGAESLDPICGVFVLHGEGFTFDRNLIAENGHSDSANDPLRPGRRGGVVLSLARTPVTPEFSPFFEGTAEGLVGVRQTGIPALHFHDNVVVSPAGRALEVIALGPVSILGNELTARGSLVQNSLSIAGAGTNQKGATLAASLAYASLAKASNPVVALMDLLGGAVVAVMNLGVSNEVYLQLFGLSGLFLLDDLPTPESGDDDTVPRFFVGGNVLFNDNQVVLDAFSPGTTFTLSSVLLLTLDDISMQGNQCDCDLVVDVALLNALVLGWSIRVSDNRFKEGLLNTVFSGLTLALMNETTDNQSTHCLYPIGVPILSNREHNHALVQFANRDACQSFGDRLAGHYQLG